MALASSQARYELWAANIQKPKVDNWKEEIEKLRDFKDFIEGPYRHLKWEHPITEKRVRFDHLPDAFRTSIQHIWMWGAEEDRTRVQNDDPPRMSEDDDAENGEEEDEYQPKATTWAGKAMEKVTTLEARDIQTLDDLEECEDGTAPVIGVVRQPVIFVNSRLPSTAKSQLAKHRVGYISIDRGTYFGLSACLMLGIWEGEVCKQLDYPVGTALHNEDLVTALTVIAADPDHEPVFNWLRQQGLTVGAHFRRRGDSWYAPLMPLAFESGGGYVDEWAWPGGRK